MKNNLFRGTVILLSAALLTACNAGETALPTEPETYAIEATEVIRDGVNLTQIKRHIEDMEEFVFSFVAHLAWDEEKEWDSDYVVKVGEDGAFYRLCSEMENYCEPKIVKVLLDKNGYDVNDEGDIGLVLADGEVAYPFYNEASMKVLSESDSLMQILVRRYSGGVDLNGISPYEDDVYRDIVYTFELNGSGNFIVTDMSELNESGELSEIRGSW